jgi:uncharacterized Rmd1/YagE family protein
MTSDPSEIHPARMIAVALLIGDRIDTAGYQPGRVLSALPLAFAFGERGFVAVFRYGVVVFIGLTQREHEAVLHELRPRVKGEFAVREEEAAVIEVRPDADDQIAPGGPIAMRMPSPERLLVVADALAKSVVLAYDERQVANVFDILEPFAGKLARDGRTPGGRRDMLRHIGQALLVQQRVSGRAAVTDKPDVLWERPDLERLYARLEDEYELKERAFALDRKLRVITDTAGALTDIIDTERSLRLEIVIVLLIAFEIVLAALGR